MQVIKPVGTCVTCQTQFKLLNELYGMYKTLPEPGIKGVLQATVEEYNQHHKEVHPVHPDAVTPEKKQGVKDLLKQFEGIQVFDANGVPLVHNGLVFAYKNHLVAVGPSTRENLGAFIPALSTVTLEEHCVEMWHEYFGGKEE